MVEPAEYVAITEDGGIVKKIITPGYCEGVPLKGQQVIILFTTYLPNGTVIQSVSDPERATTFLTDSEAVFKGLILAALSMKRGEKSRFKIKPAYGYGESGPEKLPKDSEIEAEVEMLDFHDRWKLMFDLTENERLEFAVKLKATGNEHFKNGRIKSATYFYRYGIEYVDGLVPGDFSKIPGNVLELRRSLYLNLAVVCNMLEKWHSTIGYCSTIIDKESDNGKARYLRGVAYSKVGKYDDALADLTLSLKKTPDDPKIQMLIKEIKEYEFQQKQNENQG